MNVISISNYVKIIMKQLIFFPNYACLIILNRPLIGRIYEWSSTGVSQPITPMTFSSVKTNLQDWYQRLSHPSDKILHQTINRYYLPVSLKINIIILHAIAINLIELVLEFHLYLAINHYNYFT